MLRPRALHTPRLRTTTNLALIDYNYIRKPSTACIAISLRRSLCVPDSPLLIPVLYSGLRTTVGLSRLNIMSLGRLPLHRLAVSLPPSSQLCCFVIFIALPAVVIVLGLSVFCWCKSTGTTARFLQSYSMIGFMRSLCLIWNKTYLWICVELIMYWWGNTGYSCSTLRNSLG